MNSLSEPPAVAGGHCQNRLRSDRLVAQLTTGMSDWQGLFLPFPLGRGKRGRVLAAERKPLSLPSPKGRGVIDFLLAEFSHKLGSGRAHGRGPNVRKQTR